LPEIKAEKKPEPLELPPLPPKQQISQQKSPQTSLQINHQTREAALQRAPTPAQPSAERLTKEFKLPTIEHPARRETIQLSQPRPIIAHDEDLKKFEEAINNINIDIIHSQTPAEAMPGPSAEEESYYKPSEMGEGYFSEIEHYIRNKDINEIIDDVLKKDFLTGMKDYHDTKAQGKPFYLHKEDLKNKLKIKMDQLRRLEEEWHSIKARIEEEEKRKRLIEKEIDWQSQELKDLFKQVKINQWLEQEAPKEHYFKLRNGQELKSLNDLRKALIYMTDEDFNYHVSQEKNDFATWVREALQNQELYEKIKNIKTKEELQAVLQTPT
jgi:hypothetical protein